MLRSIPKNIELNKKVSRLHPGNTSKLQQQQDVNITLNCVK